MRQLRPEELVEWISLRDACGVFKQITGNAYAPATIYAWAKKGVLGTNGFHPLKTTREHIRRCAEEHLKMKKQP